MSREDENGTYSHDDIPNLPLNHNAIELVMDLPFDPSEDLTFSNTMTMPLYSMLLKFLIIVENPSFSCKIADKKWDKKQKEAWKMFVRKNTFNLFHNKNRQRPIFKLKKDAVGLHSVNKYDKLPIVLRHT